MHKEIRFASIEIRRRQALQKKSAAGLKVTKSLISMQSIEFKKEIKYTNKWKREFIQIVTFVLLYDDSN